MDKNILAEYQKRIEEMQYTQEHAKLELEEAIEARKTELETKIRTEQNELAQVINESQVQLEELQGPVNMDDVSRRQIIDRRGGKTAIREYSQDEEGKLLREFDIAVNDSAVTNEEIEQIVEALRKERERIREEQRKALNANIKSAQARQEAVARELSEEQEKIATEEAARKEEIANDTEATKNQLLVELQEARKQIEDNIQRKKGNISQKISEFDRAHAEGIIHKQALSLYKNTGSKVYTAAEAELKECIRKAELSQRRVKRLEREIVHLEQDLAQVDELLDSLSMDKISRQEDEMWKAYREEQEKQTAEMEENKDYIMNAEMELHNGEEKAEEEKTQKQTEREIRAYGDTGITPEEEPIEPREYKIPVKPTKAGQKPPQPNSKQKPENWKVASVAFSIEGGSNPIYRVIVSKGEEKREFTSTEIAMLDSEFDKNEIKTLADRYGIHQADKFYDKGLAKALEKVDAEYGTQSLKEYEQLLKDKEMIHRYPERYENAMDISYDFSGLLVKPDENMKKLQDLAKANKRKGIVTEFKKRPNFLMRIIKRIFTKALPKTTEPISKSEKTQKTDEKTAKMLEELDAQMAKESQELTETRMLKDWSDMHTEPGFDIEEFVKGMPMEEANRYRTMQDEYEAGLEKDPYAAFRKRMQEEAENGKQPAQAEKAEEPKKDEDVIEVDPEDVKLLDPDGNEVEF